MNPCTWKAKDKPACTDPAVAEQRGSDGKVWANLCHTHDVQLTRAIASGDPKRILSTWIAAAGGPKAVLGRM